MAWIINKPKDHGSYLILLLHKEANKHQINQATSEMSQRDGFSNINPGFQPTLPTTSRDAIIILPLQDFDEGSYL